MSLADVMRDTAVDQTIGRLNGVAFYLDYLADRAGTEAESNALIARSTSYLAAATVIAAAGSIDSEKAVKFANNILMYCTRALDGDQPFDEYASFHKILFSLLVEKKEE